jgi:hypothetical protein
MTFKRFRSFPVHALCLVIGCIAGQAGAQTPVPAPSSSSTGNDAPASSPASSPAQSNSQPSAAVPNAPVPQTHQNGKRTSEQQLKAAEKQRILGVLPNFNTSFDRNAPPLKAGQKIRLAFRAAIDPATFVIAALDGGVNMAERSYPAYGNGPEGYAKYLGASYADSFDGTMIGNALLPALLKQDPRYFRMGESHTIKRRILYAISTTVWCKNDNGKWGPNYSNVFGNLIAGGISNAYYPAADRGASLTIERGLTVTGEGTLGGLADEFWPDIARKVFKKGRLSQGIPASEPQPAPAPPVEPK